MNLNDIRNISLADIRNFVNEHQALVLSVILGFIALITAGVILNGRFAEYSTLRIELAALRSKEQPVKTYNDLAQGARHALQALPPALSENDIISFVTEIANHRDIQINSFEPAQTKTKGFYRQTSLEFACSAKSFQNALLFVHDLENARFLIKVDALDINKSTHAQAVGRESNNDISLGVSISSIELIYDDQKKAKK